MFAGITDHFITNASPPLSSRPKTRKFATMMLTVTIGKCTGRRDASVNGIRPATPSSSNHHMYGRANRADAKTTNADLLRGLDQLTRNEYIYTDIACSSKKRCNGYCVLRSLDVPSLPRIQPSGAGKVFVSNGRYVDLNIDAIHERSRARYRRTQKNTPQGLICGAWRTDGG